MEWIIQNNYSIIAKQKKNLNSNINNGSESDDDTDDDVLNEYNIHNNCQIKMQLYSQKTNNNNFEYQYYNHYRLDIQRMHGGTFPFLDLCSKLMAKLKYLPTNNQITNIYLKNKN